MMMLYKWVCCIIYKPIITMADTPPSFLCQAFFLKAMLLSLLIFSSSSQAILSSLDYSNFQTGSNTFSGNFAGVSLNFSQIYTSVMNTTLFQALLANARAFGSNNGFFSLSIKTQWPKGFKYNCTQYASLGFNVTCLFNYSSINNRITPFTRATGNHINRGVVFGFDMENADINNPSFQTIFSSNAAGLITAVGSGFYDTPIEAFDEADTFAAREIIANYTPSRFVADVNTLTALVGSMTPIHGPGITMGADPSWLDTFNQLRGNPTFVYTLKAVVFNSSTPTIADLLNQANYRDFILKRLTYNGQLLNAASGAIMFTEYKITDGVGVDGVTNTFAAALWAIDSAIEFAMFGGKGMKFPLDIQPGNFQTVLGPAPNYLPTPLYFGMLFLTALSYTIPAIGMPLITAGTSSSIKAYGFLIPTQLTVVILNKDTNPNASGVVNVTLNSRESIKCHYLTAPFLNSTTGVRWMGYTFISGSSVPQGNYTFFMYPPVGHNTYSIPLNYSQAVMCFLVNPNVAFPIMQKSEKATTFFLSIMLLAIMLWGQ